MLGMKRFQRKKEDFVCANCGEKVQGVGYTDHCPKCLWSQHVDINPGDRQEDCRGLMRPIGAEVVRDGYIIYYQCEKCGFKHQVKSAENDNFEEIVRLVKEVI
jgi:DNA-directed RNA polymerase subunit RPC12/RpoP